MKRITLEQLQELFASDNYNSKIEETNSEFQAHEYHKEYRTEEGEDETKTVFESWRAGYVTLTSKTDPTITIEFAYKANGGQNSYTEAHDFEVEIEDITNLSFKLVDEDGDATTLRVQDLDFLNDDLKIDIIANLPTAEIDETNLAEKSEMRLFTLENDNAPDVKFNGERIGFASSADPYNRHNGRWTELRLYKTAGGMFVCQSAGLTRWQGEKNRYSTQVCETEKDVIEFFKYTRLAKELYEEANIDFAVVID